MNDSQDDTGQRVLALSRSMHDALNRALDAFDEAQSWDDFQNAFAKVRDVLRTMNPSARHHALETLADYFEVELLSHGFRKGDVKLLRKPLLRNWDEIARTDGVLDIRTVYRKVSTEWEQLHNHLDELEDQIAVSCESKKSLVVPIGRLFTGVGALIFDAANALVVSPVPTMVFTTIMGGAVLFWQGLDGILKEGE